MARNITECQLRLLSLGYPVGPAGADGKFGHDSLDAFNRFRASKGLGPVLKTSMEELNRLLFPEEQPEPPKPIRKPGLLDVLAVVFNLSKGTSNMKYSTVEQLIRIAGYTVGSYFLGDAIANGQTFQAAIGGAVAIGAFVWWLVFERNRVAK